MKNYKQLVKTLPSKTVVFAFGRFNPPTIGHELLIKSVKKLADKNKAAHAIYASKTQNTKKDPLSIDKKIQYLNLLFPDTNFIAASAEVPTFIQAAQQLNKKYKNLIMVAGSDRVPEYTKILNTYNGKEYNFDSIQLISAGERDPDSDSASGMSATKMRSAASKGDYTEFKKGLPTHIRDLDAKRLMNDVRQGLGLDVIKEQIKFNVDDTREKYFQGCIFLEGQLVESAGKQYTIIKRGSNHLLLQDSDGVKVSKWIKDVTLIPEENIETVGYEMNEELSTKTIKPTDKLKVARMIASFLGNEDAEKSSNAENLVNSALRKAKSKITHADSIAMLNKMLSLADEVGINYDTALVPGKIKEAHEPRVAPINKKSERNGGGDILSLKDYNKLSALNKGKVTEETGLAKDTADDDNEVHIVSPAGASVAPQQLHHTKVGHTLSAPEDDTNRRMKVHYKTEEVELDEISTATARDVHAARVDQYNKAKKSGDADATAKAQGKMKSSFKHYLNKDKKDNAKLFSKQPKDVEGIKKAANAEHEYNKSRGLSNEETELSIEGYDSSLEKRLARTVPNYNKSLDRAKSAAADAHRAQSKEKTSNVETTPKRMSHKELFKKLLNIEEVELDEAKMKMTYKDWLKQTGKNHSPENTELYKKTQKEGTIQPNGTDAVMTREDVYSSDYKINPETGRKVHPRRINFANSGVKDKLEPEDIKEAKKLKNTPVKNDDQQIGVNNAHGFDAFFSEESDDLSDREMNDIVDSIKDENDILDVYDDDELSIIDAETGEELHKTIKEEIEAINEVLSRAERVKAKMRFARSESKRERKIQVALKRHSDTKTLNSRARKLAIVLMKKRLAKKPLDKLTVGEKERIETIIARRKTSINRLAMKLAPRVRKIEQDRLAHHKFTKA